MGSSHMLDLSEEFDEENIATCVKYLKRMAAVKLWLEMEIGITGGEEDGVDNSGVKAEALYTTPQQVFKVHQAFAKEQLKCSEEKPLYLVMHGGSGSSAAEIGEAVSNGVVKMNIDTDTQWAYWDGLRGFYKKNEGYLQGQIGNPDGADKPNKKYYDPRV